MSYGQRFRWPYLLPAVREDRSKNEREITLADGTTFMANAIASRFWVNWPVAKGDKVLIDFEGAESPPYAVVSVFREDSLIGLPDNIRQSTIRTGNSTS